MTEKNSKRFCVIDHADKLGDRSGTNPNRLSRLKEARFRALEVRIAGLRVARKKYEQDSRSRH